MGEGPALGIGQSRVPLAAMPFSSCVNLSGFSFLVYQMVRASPTTLSTVRSLLPGRR